MKELLILAAFGVAVSQGLLTPNTPESYLRKHLGEPVFHTESAIEAAPPCNDVHLQKCQVEFNTAAGINTTIDWRQPWAFRQQLQIIYNVAKQFGITQICNAYTKFSQCLGATYPSCINQRHFLQRHLSLPAATFYPTILTQLHFQCGGGLGTLLYNWNCIGPLEISANKTIQACNEAYTRNISNDPFHPCKYGALLLHCVQAPFLRQCNAESGWFECEYTRVGLAFQLPYCNLACTVGGASSKENEPINIEGPSKYHDLQDPLLSLNSGQNIYGDIAKAAAEAEESNRKKK
jgi:hypothetical protein